MADTGYQGLQKNHAKTELPKKKLRRILFQRWIRKTING